MKPRCLLIMMVLASLGAPALLCPVQAQPDVTWERVGDLPHDSFSLPYSVGPDDFLWSGFNDVQSVNGQQIFFQGLYRLPPPYDSASVWEKVSPPPFGSIGSAYVIARDTILIEGFRTHRSIDGGATWEEIISFNSLSGMIEVPAGLLYAGRLIGANGSDMASFSDDRGLTWTRAPVDRSFNDPPTIADSAAAERIAVITTGPHAGRLVAGGLSGITISDDGGYTWQATSEFAYFQQDTENIAILHGQAPGGGDRVVSVVNDSRIPDDSVRVIVSDDGGETWQRKQGLFPGDFRACVEVVDLGEGRAVAVMMSGPLWWTEDAGETWVRWAEWEELAPPEDVINGDARAHWAMVAPDGRLIIGVASNESAQSLYDRRSSEPVASWAVSSEPQTEKEETSLRVSPNPSRQLVTVELVGVDRERHQLVVVDSIGREVARTELSGGSSWGLEVSSWPPGQYYARVVDELGLNSVPFTVLR